MLIQGFVLHGGSNGGCRRFLLVSLHSQGAHKCEECAYVASSKTNLERHMINHRQANPIKCLYCSFSSTGEAAIQRHMAEHHDPSELPVTMRRPQHQSDMEDSRDEGM